MVQRGSLFGAIFKLIREGALSRFIYASNFKIIDEQTLLSLNRLRIPLALQCKVAQNFFAFFFVRAATENILFSQKFSEDQACSIKRNPEVSLITLAQ